MSEHVPVVMLLLGATVIGAVLLRALCRRLGIPALVGYVLIGVILSAIDGTGGIMTPNVLLVFEFLGGVGIVALLFRVGLESNIVEMLAQLRSAIWVWFGNVGLSGLLGFAVAHWLLGFSLVPSLFVATALTATSLGVCLGVWREADALDTPAGGLLIDVAELDDLSGIAAMILLFAAAPVLFAGNGGVAAALGGTLLEFLLKLAAFGAFCVMFARYVEAPVSRFFASLRPPPDPLLPVVGATFVIAAFRLARLFAGRRRAFRRLAVQPGSPCRSCRRILLVDLRLLHAVLLH